MSFNRTAFYVDLEIGAIQNRQFSVVSFCNKRSKYFSNILFFLRINGFQFALDVRVDFFILWIENQVLNVNSNIQKFVCLVFSPNIVIFQLIVLTGVNNLKKITRALCDFSIQVILFKVFFSIDVCTILKSRLELDIIFADTK